MGKLVMDFILCESKQPHKDYTDTTEENIMFTDKYWCDKNDETGISQT